MSTEESTPILDPSVVRDVKWVYEHADEIIVTGPDGEMRLNLPYVRQHAPSGGARGLAKYAAKDYKGFYQKFAHHIMTSDKKEAAQTEAQLLEEMDPSFEEMARYLDGQGVLPQ